MNSFTGSGSHRTPSSSSSSSSSSFDSYQFDFGIGSSSRPLKDQKLNPNAASSKPAAPSWTHSPPARPSWTHQPAPAAARSNLPNPSPSMAGDIFGRSWSSPSSKLGIQDKNPNLFGDLVGSAIGRSSQNVPLKSAPPKTNPSFSMADLKTSIPNSTGSFSSFPRSNPSIGSQVKSDSKPDPFVSLMARKPQQSNGSNDYSFGGFQDVKRSVSSDGSDPLNVFFSTPLASTTAAETQPIRGMDDWDVSAESTTTTEIEGLPPPPVGVTATAAKMKGLDNYKQGQFADAIKWLSWAFVLLEKSGSVDSLDEVLICRASCYKEVGEYKKAIADCSKVLGHDSTNVSVLLQRALLYESSEKYRLGAEDLRAVLKIDPGNRLAKSTIHRMNQFAD